MKCPIDGHECHCDYSNHEMCSPYVEKKGAGCLQIIGGIFVVCFIFPFFMIMKGGSDAQEEQKEHQSSPQPQYENSQSSSDYSNSNQTPEIAQQTYSEPSPIDNTVQNEPTIYESITPSIQTTDTLLTSGEWRDPATGLIWMRCSLGQTWENGTCTGEADTFNWIDAVNSAGIADGKVWRLPTTKELLTIINTPTNALFMPTSTDGYWHFRSSSAASEVVIVGNGLDGVNLKYSGNYVRLVRSSR